ncbi:uncharacterized protein TNCV_939681 [Trichonephila clavipes]|nr:uncharacterized protein TNCV_939681 [Trichonephila clavipes]
MRSVAKSSHVAEKSDVNIHSLTEVWKVIEVLVVVTLAVSCHEFLHSAAEDPPCRGCKRVRGRDRHAIRITSYIHWCAKIKDEVEKLAYQLNEKAEWTERPIRRLSKVMYGSTCADMQVDVMGECLSSIKHVVGREMANNRSVRRHLDAFTRGRIIGKLEEGRSVTSAAAEFGIAHSIVSRLWR